MPVRVRPSVVSRYEQYKSNSAELVAWLVSTASRCGYGDPKHTSKRPVPVDKLHKCAQAIARKRPFVEIPGSTVEKIEEIVQGRRLHALDLREQGSGSGNGGGSSRAEKEKKKAEEGHAYIVVVLGRVRAVLVEARRVQREWREENAPKRVASCESSHKDEAIPLRTKFEHLELQEPVELPLGAPAMMKEAAKPEVALAVDPMEESAFILFCYLHDMYDIRVWVKNVWQDYASGEISLLFATSSTEQAFACIRRSESALQRDFDRHDFGCARALFIAYCDLAVAVFQEGRDFYSKDCNHIAHDRLCVDTYTLVTEAVSELMRTKDARNSETAYEQSEKATEISKTHPFACALFERIPDLTDARDLKDEFSYAFSDGDGGYDMWITTVMICQCYKDIYDIVGDPSSLVLDQAAETVHAAQQAIEEFKQVKNNTRGPPSFLENTETFVFAINAEACLIELTKLTNTQNIDAEWISQTRLRKAFPVAAGDDLRLIKLHILQVSAIIVNGGWVILSLAYLYRAAKRFGLMTINWPDMDWFIALQSRSKQYLLEVSPYADPMAHARLFKIARGTPTDKSVRKMRSAKPQNYWLQQAEKLDEGDTEKNIGYDATMYRDISKSKHLANSYTDLELLNAFKADYIRDESEMNFSYFDFYNSAATLLHKMANIVGDRIHVRYRADFGIDMEITEALLKEAGATNIAGQPMMTTQLALAAKIMQKHIKEEGGKLTQAAFDLSSGTIAEERRPKLLIAGRRRVTV